MATSSLTFTSDDALRTDEGTILLLVRSGDAPVVIGSDAVDQPTLSALGFTGTAEQHGVIVLDGRRIELVGVGSELTERSVRRAVGSAVLKAEGENSYRIVVPAGLLAAAAEGAALGSYRFRTYRGTLSTATTVPPIVLHTTDDDAATTVERVLAVADSVALVKDLANTPGRDLPPAELAARAIDAVAELPVEVTVWDEKELADGGFGGITGVGQGSSRPPRLVKLSYSPAGAQAHLALVGKGITFDTGGLSLKPATSMTGMKYDMAGAATVLGTLVAAARLGVATRITAWLCVAENMPSGTAIRPDDVLTMKNGTTVEVTNTDAEGRLVLADGLVMASEEHPDAIVDVATLTGAALVALGRRTAAVMGDSALGQRILDLAGTADEPMWAMPFPEELREVLKSNVADLINAKIGGYGGTLTAGLFLREFVGTVDGGDERIPWAHLDIAGPGDNPDAPHGFTGKGATAFSLRTLLGLAEELATP
ncbi:leucyl aminopeptidase [Mycetocola reblochoni]|uniref:Probable cytosol aminopeptidase n=2 Tax=Mycetocola reblochoni TaxID=331618 RepID=A0A1R4K6M8_9MICO|nr:leucyl aminopeptidase [Mycetocola reblochoni]RLP67995.1 leucyl aminopeptidase [Mycetocola reblochoni]SJN39782.1 Cytosol aminopeptidase PepA [Mycetocola reblochoni REB411]